MFGKIKKIISREILDSRGNPTIETKVIINDRIWAKASVPSGASTGAHEALELKDKNSRFGGKGVLKAIKNVNLKIAPQLIGEKAVNQEKIDNIMLEMDGTENKSKLGANAILSVSLACCRAASMYENLPLYQYIKHAFGFEFKKFILPVPGFNVLNGGRHADNGLEFQEFMIYPKGVKSFAEKVRAGAEIFHALKEILKERNLNTGVGDEGGFAPVLESNEKALDLILEAVAKTSWHMGKDIFIALDPASSEFFDNKKYLIKGQNYSTKQMIDYWENLINKYPIVSIEDPIAEDDWNGWKKITERLGKKIQLVGDDFLVTNKERLKKAIKEKAGNAVLIKLNQIGSLSETIETIKLAQKSKYKVMVSHRSGETTDDFISDLAVGTNAGQIKSGSLSRGERLAKYNRLMEIEMEINGKI